MPTTTTNAARDTLTDTVLPAVRTGLTLAREKGTELLASDAAQEARRRGAAMLLAARGEPLVEIRTARRWPRVLGLVAIATMISLGVTWLLRRMTEPVESYRIGPLPVPGDDAVSIPAGAEDIDLRAGSTTMR